MSDKIDVLTAIDVAIEGIHGEGYECSYLEQARAVVVQLIDAAKHCEDILMCYSIDRVDGEEIADTALKVLRSALARANGEYA